MNKLILTLLFTIVVHESDLKAQFLYKLPIEYTDYQLIFGTITINGEKVTALFDTGNFSELRISITFAKKHGIQLRSAEITSKSVNGSNGDIMKGKLDSLSIAGLILKNYEFDCIENYIENVSKKVNKSFDVVVGWPFFRNYFFELDIKRQYLSFSKKQFWKENDSGFIPLVSVNNVPVIKGEIQGTISNLLFDCGAPFSKIDSSFASQIIREKDTLESFKSYKIPMKVFDVTFHDSKYRINLNPSDIKNTRCNGIIGNNFISKYQIRFNPISSSIKFVSL